MKSALHCQAKKDAEIALKELTPAPLLSPTSPKQLPKLQREPLSFNTPTRRTLTDRVSAAERHIKALTKEKHRLEQKIELNRSKSELEKAHLEGLSQRNSIRINKVFAENEELKKERNQLAVKVRLLSVLVKELQASLDLQQQKVG